MTRRLVRFENAEARPTPVILLAELRRIDDTVELVYPGWGTWWLGSVRPSDARTRRGENMLAFEERRDHPNPKNIHLAHLALQGFALIAAYDGADPAGVMICEKGTSGQYETTILNDFAERDAAWRRDGGERAFHDKLKIALGDERQAAAQREMDAYMAADGRDHYRREIRNRVTFGPGGMTGGSGRLILPGQSLLEVGL